MMKSTPIFQNRIEAGKRVAAALEKYKNLNDVVVLGLLRGGIVLAFEIAKSLAAPLHFIIVRKIGAPENSELALGAITEDDVILFTPELWASYHLSKEERDILLFEAKKEITRRIQLYRDVYPKKTLKGKIAIIVDDGIATGTTVQAAVQSARVRGAKRTVVAVPVCSADSSEQLQHAADEVVCIESIDLFFAVGAFYNDFSQVEDEEVLEILNKAQSLSYNR